MASSTANHPAQDLAARRLPSSSLPGGGCARLPESKDRTMSSKPDFVIVPATAGFYVVDLVEGATSNEADLYTNCIPIIAWKVYYTNEDNNIEPVVVNGQSHRHLSWYAIVDPEGHHHSPDRLDSFATLEEWKEYAIKQWKECKSIRAYMEKMKSKREKELATA
jgi:hypothetical protein